MSFRCSNPDRYGCAKAIQKFCHMQVTRQLLKGGITCARKNKNIRVHVAAGLL